MTTTRKLKLAFMALLAGWVLSSSELFAQLIEIEIKTFFSVDETTPIIVKRFLNIHPSGSGLRVIAEGNKVEKCYRWTPLGCEYDWLGPIKSAPQGICRYIEKEVFLIPTQSGQHIWSERPSKASELSIVPPPKVMQALKGVGCPTRTDDDSYIAVRGVSDAEFLKILKFWEKFRATIQNSKSTPSSVPEAIRLDSDFSKNFIALKKVLATKYGAHLSSISPTLPYPIALKQMFDARDCYDLAVGETGFTLVVRDTSGGFELLNVELAIP